MRVRADFDSESPKALSFPWIDDTWCDDRKWWLGFNLSVAVAVGFIALAGVAAETGVVRLIYLNQALAEIKFRRDIEGRALTRGDLTTPSWKVRSSVCGRT